MSFWDFVWLIVISFAFVAYLMLLFRIMIDVIRDQSASGFVKALWIILLIFFPLLTALVYLIVRGKSMAEREYATATAAVSAQESYIRSVAGAATPADQIAQAKSLLDAGAINQAEFDRLKAQALG